MNELEKLNRANSPEGSLFEGIVSFRAVLESGRKILRLLYDEKKAAKGEREYAFLRAKAGERGFQIDLLPRERLDAIAVGSSHGGLLFYCGEREIPPLTGAALLPRGFYMLLDGVEDPYNFGYALRSLYAAGVDGLILPARNWMNAAGIVCRASAGASERMPMLRAEDPEVLCRIFHEQGYHIVCTGMENAVSLDDAEDGALLPPLLLAVGGERRGIGRTVLKACEMTVRIPYGREFPEALSTASAAAVLAFETARRIRASKK